MSTRKPPKPADTELAKAIRYLADTLRETANTDQLSRIEAKLDRLVQEHDAEAIALAAEAKAGLDQIETDTQGAVQ